MTRYYVVTTREDSAKKMYIMKERKMKYKKRCNRYHWVRMSAQISRSALRHEGKYGQVDV
jgi:hypothetical protein